MRLAANGNDAAVARRVRPRFVTPMKALLTDARPSGDEWVFERKLDGIRCLAVKNGGRTIEEIAQGAR